MTQLNFPQVYSKITKDLDKRPREILARRFGIEKDSSPETLQSIGEDFDITRERVRQIENKCFSDIKKESREILNKIFAELVDYFKKKGGFKKEDIALKDLGGEKYQSYVLFFLNLGKQFSLVTEKEDFHSFWTTIKKNPVPQVKKLLDKLTGDLKKKGEPQIKEDFVNRFSSQNNLDKEKTISVIEVSKQIEENREGKIGLVDWPEINPKGVRDKSFLVFRKKEEPLHFRKVAELIDELGYNPGKQAHPQTVHNELIKDDRFVLVGRGIYALKEWGYEPGTVKDIIEKTLKESNEPLEKEEVIEKVLSQREVAKNTVLMNLHNNDTFYRNSEGKYVLRDTQTS